MILKGAKTSPNHIGLGPVRQASDGRGIAKLMIIVGVVALNLAAIQFWSPSSDPSLFTGRFLMLITSFVPQFFVALRGGVLISLTVRLWSKRHDPAALRSATA